MRLRYMHDGSDTVISCLKVSKSGRYLLIDFLRDGKLEKFVADTGSSGAANEAMDVLASTGCVDVREFVVTNMSD